MAQEESMTFTNSTCLQWNGKKSIPLQVCHRVQGTLMLRLFTVIAFMCMVATMARIAVTFITIILLPIHGVLYQQQDDLQKLDIGQHVLFTRTV